MRLIVFVPGNPDSDAGLNPTTEQHQAKTK
jgi:hypothetical protein